MDKFNVPSSFQLLSEIGEATGSILDSKVRFWLCNRFQTHWLQLIEDRFISLSTVVNYQLVHCLYFKKILF